MNNKSVLDELLKDYSNKTEKDLLKEYDVVKAMPVIQKLRSLISKIEDPGHKSIAIFISKSTEKLIYFNQSDYLESHPYPKI